jgi:hypothetical protein
MKVKTIHLVGAEVVARVGGASNMTLLQELYETEDGRWFLRTTAGIKKLSNDEASALLKTSSKPH